MLRSPQYERYVRHIREAGKETAAKETHPGGKRGHEEKEIVGRFFRIMAD